MKSIFKVFLLSMTLMVFFTSCEDDGTIGGPIIEDDVVMLSLSSESGFVSSSATVNPGESFSVRLIGEKGEDDLQAITVREDGVSLDISRFTATNSSIGGNPFTLGTDEAASFSKDITITSPTVAGDYMYTFVLTDFAGNTDSESVTITVNVTPPSLTYMGSGMIMAELGNLVSVPIMASAGTSPLEQIAVFVDGELVPFQDLYYGEPSNQFGSNPGLLPESDTLTLDRTLFIRANNVGESTYTIVITDQAGETASYDIVVTTGTEVKMIEGALLNSAGPSGTGGLDLETGNSVGSNNADADIKDEGIDTDLPDDSNWLRQISGANGAEIRSLTAGENGLGENFTFGDVSISEQIAAIWSNGSTLTQMNEDSELVTNQLNGGELFVVFDGATYFLISISEVRITDVGNGDEYLIDIKF